MTSYAQVTALVDAHVKRDHDRFRSITLQIAAHMSSRSERGADHLRKLVEHYQAVSLIPLPSANGLLSVPSHVASLDDMVLAPQIRDRLDRIVLEHARKEDLRAHGLRPAHKLLFTGIPGVGKSMAAGALAQAVGLPLFRVELHGVISSHLGETAGKLAKIFEHVRSMQAVYLFDEFDALGTERSADRDSSGEMRRVVNSLLQFIEDDRSDSLIIAATNHAPMLDGALFRRFDEMIEFVPLTRVELGALIDRDLPECTLDVEAIYEANTKLGHADLCVVLDRVRKDQVLVGMPITTKGIVEGILSRTRGGVAS